MFEELDIESKVAHPNKVKVIAGSKVKTDSIDTRTLAQLMRAGLVLEPAFPRTKSGSSGKGDEELLELQVGEDLTAFEADDIQLYN